MTGTAFVLKDEARSYSILPKYENSAVHFLNNSKMDRKNSNILIQVLHLLYTAVVNVKYRDANGGKRESKWHRSELSFFDSFKYRIPTPSYEF